MEDKKILIVHPYDQTTFFLQRIRNSLQQNFGGLVHYFNVKTNDYSHTLCLDKINQNGNGLVIFLGHGRSDKLYGAKGDLYSYSKTASEDAIIEHPEKYYFNDNFINETNSRVFEGKKVFCLSCNSNEKLANAAIENGAICFLGFGDIPTSLEEFSKMGEHVSNDVVNGMKAEITYIVKSALVYCLFNKYSFTKLANVIRFVTDQRITDLLVEKKGFKERLALADHLYFFKSELKLFGNGESAVF